MRDRAAVDIYLLAVHTKLADHDEALRGEGLVELDEVQLANLDPGPFHQFPDGGDRPSAHHPGVDPGHGARDEIPERVGANVTRSSLRRRPPQRTRRRLHPRSSRR